MPTRALIIDDEPGFAELVQAVLTGAGMQAEVATNSSGAAARLAKEKFDVVFLDIRMPAPDGIELARLIRAAGMNRNTPIVMITGEADVAMQRKGFEAGASFFLFKPVDRHRLLRVVRAAQAAVQHEKRRFQRVPMARKVSVSFGSQTLEGTTVDISLGGLLAQLNGSLANNAPVAVFLHAETGGPLRARARVVRVLEGDKIGVRFESMDAVDSERLQEMLLPLILKQLDEEPEPPAPKK
jgi:CheY-like chemotaxis protein